MNYSRQDNKYYSAWANISPAELGNFNFNGNFDQTGTLVSRHQTRNVVRQKSAYVATQHFTLADPLHILGARYTNWNRETLSSEMEKNNTTPYGGVIWDFYDNWSAYASYTSVFQPQDYQDASGGYLSPVI
ncbi:TonB-dependent receptor (plasmid) [Pseudomonas silvicola]|nr:TonB-dependent receptor [Pseudomonas silvicola]